MLMSAVAPTFRQSSTTISAIGALRIKNSSEVHGMIGLYLDAVLSDIPDVR